MSKAEALKGMADDVKSAAKGAAAYAKRGVGYPPPPVMAMDAELAEGSSRTKDAQPEPKDEWREYVRGVVYGGLDGVLTIFALMASAFGAEVNIRNLMAMGIANVLADGMSMGFGGYVSSLSEVEQNQSTRERVGAMCDDSVAEALRKFYADEQGMSHSDACSLVDILKKYPILMKQRYCAEIEGVLAAAEDGSPAMEGKVTFQSFLLFGSLPLLPIMVALLLPDSDSQESFNGAVGFSILFTVLTLGFLGYTKAHLTGQAKLPQCLLMVTNGVFCAGVSYLAAFGAGEALENLLDNRN